MTYTRLKRTYKARKSVVLFKSQGFSEERKYLAINREKSSQGEPRLRKRYSSAIVAEATAFNKDLWAAASLQIISFKPESSLYLRFYAKTEHSL